MEAVASLPPYAHITQEVVRCVAHASARYQVPELLLHSILLKENGRAGACVSNRNGSSDCGLAQINTVWREYVERKGIPWAAVRDDACTNVHVSAYILRTYARQKQGDWFSASVAYNIGPNNWTSARYAIGYRYAADVLGTWRYLQAWVDRNNPGAPSSSLRANR